MTTEIVLIMKILVPLSSVLIAAIRIWQIWVTRDNNKSVIASHLPDGTKVISVNGYASEEAVKILKQVPKSPNSSSASATEVIDIKKRGNNKLSAVPKILK